MANIGLRQSLSLRQNLVMTQRLQQALKLLQVPTLELEQILRHELQGNPLLEEIEPEDELEDEIRHEDEIEAMDERERETEMNTEDQERDWGDSWDEGFRGATNNSSYGGYGWAILPCFSFTAATPRVTRDVGAEEDEKATQPDDDDRRRARAAR